MQRQRICLVDANSITRIGIASTLRQSNLSAGDVEAFASLNELKAVLDFEQFDVLLLDDLGLSASELAQVIKELHQRSPAMKVVVLSARLSVTRIRLAIQNGALGFICKEDELEHYLAGGICTVQRNLVYHSPKVSELLSMNNQLLTLSNLKQQDMQVLQLMAEGYTVQQIALKLGLSDRSVYRSRGKLREVLDVPTTEKIIDAARDQGLLGDE